MGGVVATTGPDPEHPMRSGPLVGDLVPGLMAALGLVSAVLHARSTGEGQFLDVAMLDCLASIVWDAPLDYIASDARTARVGNQMALVPANSYTCKDGTVVIMAGQQHQWAKLTRGEVTVLANSHVG